MPPLLAGGGVTAPDPDENRELRLVVLVLVLLLVCSIIGWLAS